MNYVYLIMSMTDNNPVPDKKTLLVFLVVVVLLGGNFIAVKFSNTELAPFWGAALRFAACTIILTAIMRWERLDFPRGKVFYGAFFYGLLSFGILYALVYWALLSVSSGLTSVLFATLPLMTLIIAAIFGLERLRWLNIIGALVVVAGVALIFVRQLNGELQFLPIVAVLLATAAGAVSTVIVKRLDNPNPISLNTIGIGIGTIFLLISSFIAKEPITLPTLTATWLAMGYLVLSTVVAFISFVWLVNRWMASATSYTLVLAPIVTIFLGSWFLQEPITINFILGAAMVLGGVYIGIIKPATS